MKADLSSLKGLRIILLVTIFLTFILLCLGSFVRVTGAGLACPDWPLCFGKAVPDDFGNGVFQEVAHRYLAGFVGIFTAYIAYSLKQKSHLAPGAWKLIKIILVVLVIQIIFGGLTVTQKLNPFVVTTHLGLGTLFFHLMFQLYITIGGLNRFINSIPHSFAKLKKKYFGLSHFVILQILIGGFMATSGASLVCPEVLTCREGHLFPEMFGGKEALHMTHRLVGILVLLYSGVVIKKSFSDEIKTTFSRNYALAIAFLIFLQIIVGFVNLLSKISLHAGITHLALAQLILLLTLFAYRVGKIKEAE